VTIGSIPLGKEVFQPILQAKDGNRRLHPEGDIAVLLKETLGEAILVKTRISVVGLEKPVKVKVDEGTRLRYGFLSHFDDDRTVTYSNKVSTHTQIDDSPIIVSFETSANSRRSKPDEIEARKIITIKGAEETVHKITTHPMFASICMLLRTRDTSKIQVYEDKPATPEFSITLAARPVYQPSSPAGGTYSFGESAKDGDVSILLSRIFGDEAKTREFSWKRAFRSRGGQSMDNPLLIWPSDWNARFDVPVEIGGKKFTISYEEPQSREERLVPPEGELIARRIITIKGDKELVARVQDHPDLAKICAELDQRDIEGIKKRIADAERRKKGGPITTATTRVFSQTERYSHTAGINPDQGFMKPGSAGKPRNVLEGVKGLRMKEKPGTWRPR